MRRRVLVLGASGMAGHVVSAYLTQQGYEVDTLAGRHPYDDGTTLLDVAQTVRLHRFLDATTHDVVVNCIALLLDECEQDKPLAVRLNALLPLELEAHYQASGTKVVHLSTDAVFAPRTEPHPEDSSYDGQSFYGRTKALGEIDNPKDLTFRTSLVGPAMRPGGKGLFHWFCQQEGEVQGFTNAPWNGITTVELAKAVEEAIKQDLAGIYHIVPADGVSKFDLLRLFRTVFERRDLDVRPARGPSFNTILANTREDFDYVIPDYTTMVRDMRTWIERHASLYSHYDF